MNTDGETMTPRMARLRRDLEDGNEQALNEFRETLAAEGAPLIEADLEDGAYSFVTFLWFGTQETNSVFLKIAIDGTGQDEHEMTQMLDIHLWYATFRLRNDYRGTYKFLVYTGPDPETFVESPDPLNSKTFVEPKDSERPDHVEDDIDSVVRLPETLPQPWLLQRAEVPTGKVERHRFHSNGLDNERRIWVYTPPGYTTTGKPYGALVVLDGRFFTFAIRTPLILDNLRNDDQILPLVAVMVDNPGDTWKQSMAIREKELSCYGPLAEFLAEEMIPWLRHNYHITTDPMETCLAGGSLGALAAVFVALQRPDIFGNVLALSGSFWWKPSDDVEWEWLTRRFALRPLLHLRFYLEVGLLESHPTASGFPGQVLSNRHLRDVLQAKGYDVYYDEQMHGHDSMAWQGALAQGLMILMGAGTRTNGAGQ